MSNLSAAKSLRLVAAITLLRSPSDRRFRIAIEEMQALRTYRETELVAASGAHIRFDRGNHGLLTDLKVEQALGAQPFDHFDHGIEAKLRRLAAISNQQIFRSNTHDHFAPCVRRKSRTDF